MLTKRQKELADRATRQAVIELLRREGIRVAKFGASASRLAKLVNQHLGVEYTDDPMDMLQAAVEGRAVDAVPSRDIRAIDQPEYKLRGWPQMAAERARACQPPMMSMCGLGDMRPSP
ncbi:hypothetical protein CAL18_12485 [Bordetella genomosp. 7]|uniref:hypothetical protein n=1 Tax=Bordetella genomosp. 7 TaxID=1416805 RepID=UPI000B9E3020|nr:hypothetical protein [Bordetella genomosp. 7]OZI21735.1 hypothetical protein CAL18_12485 [Bordetella genomosp. 7]